MIWDVIRDIWDDILDILDFLLRFLIMLVVILSITFLPNLINGKKTVIEGEFTIVTKNKSYINGKTFTLESDTKERYIVRVSNIIYQSYFVDENIKAAFVSYEKVNICNELEIKSTFEKETVKKEG